MNFIEDLKNEIFKKSYINIKVKKQYFTYNGRSN